MTREEARVREYLGYEPETGRLYWKKSNSNRALAGSEVKPQKTGYLSVRLDGKLYQGHRVIWFLMTGYWPVEEIDHEDGDPSNNRWKNLRPTNRHGNSRNTRGYATSGFKGVYRQNSLKNPWQAQIQIGATKRCLGSFPTPELAARAYDQAALELFGEFARLNFQKEDT